MPAKLPNIVYILADDLGYGDVSCLNPESKIQTPNMDRVAAEGLTCTDCHANSAVCTPTRYGVMTGRYAWRGRLKSGVLFGYDDPLIEPDRTTVASYLAAHGYATGCVGKWHLGLGWQRTGADKESIDYTQRVAAGPHTVGFEQSYIIPASLDMAPYCYLEDGRVVEQPTETCDDSERPAYWRGGPLAPGFRHETTLLELTLRAEAFLADRARQQDQPFFLYFPTSSPHTPHLARPPFQGKSHAGPYGDFVVEHDWTVGRVLNTLDRLGLADNTLVFVTSDNGCHCGPPRLWEDYQHRGNHIYRGQKSDAWDGGHRIPMLIRWPGKIEPGSRFDGTMCLTDLLATCAGICGETLPDDCGEDSVNQLPVLLGETTEGLREATVHHSISGMFAIRKGPWKLVCCPGSGGWTSPDKQMPADAPPVQLYHMGHDVEEQHNLQAEQPGIVAELQGLLQQYQEEGRSVRR